MFRARRVATFAVLLGACAAASAQLVPDLDWKETDAPPPPAFNESRLISIDMPRYMSLRFGVDPDTITIGKDGVVRYVVVASNREGGASNAFYEGVRCSTDEYRTYARFNSGAWQKDSNPDWKHIEDRNSRYTQALASQGLCRGHAPRASVGDMVRQMRYPVREVE